jgi:hypothetical protein
VPPEADVTGLEEDWMVPLELEVDEAVVLVLVADDVPGIVCSLIRPVRPTPATAANAMPAVRRLSSRTAASRLRILESGLGSMVPNCGVEV